MGRFLRTVTARTPALTALNRGAKCHVLHAKRARLPRFLKPLGRGEGRPDHPQVEPSPASRSIELDRQGRPWEHVPGGPPDPSRRARLQIT